MKPRTCSRCGERLDASGVLTVQLRRTHDGSILASPHHVCAPCLAAEAREEMETAREARQLADRMIDAAIRSTRNL